MANLTSEDVQTSILDANCSPRKTRAFRSPSYMEHIRLILHIVFSPASTLVLLFPSLIFHLPRPRERNLMASWSLRTGNWDLSVNEWTLTLHVRCRCSYQARSIGRALSAFLLLKICIPQSIVDSPFHSCTHYGQSLHGIAHIISMGSGRKNRSVSVSLSLTLVPCSLFPALVQLGDLEMVPCTELDKPISTHCAGSHIDPWPLLHSTVKTTQWQTRDSGLICHVQTIL